MGEVRIIRQPRSSKECDLAEKGFVGIEVPDREGSTP